MRDDGRNPDELRPIKFTNHIAPNATGSTLIEWGNTRVICTVCVEDGVPRWMREQSVSGGWLTAEYSMLPGSTHTRKQRDISKGKIDGRSQEIQRLIGRSLRAAIDLAKAGDKTYWVDCDVLQADGGTRTASVTGSFIALALAVQKLQLLGKIHHNPITGLVAAVSVGVVDGQVLLDLPYIEDVKADVDLNLAMTDNGEIVEIQGTGEKSTFSPDTLASMVNMGILGTKKLFELQKSALS
jgi:ribonuclease PH